MANSKHALIIFIKNPIPGKVKTRIAQTAGDTRALQIYKALLQHTRTISLSVKVERYLYYSDFIDADDEWLSTDFKKRIQQGSDLGSRMNNAFSDVLQEHEKAVIIGSDCASLTEVHLSTAFEKLESYPYVIGPAIDGGYYLLGMKKPEAALFENMNWSTADVLPVTLRRMKQSAAQCYQLTALSDIDTEADWKLFGWPLD